MITPVELDGIMEVLFKPLNLAHGAQVTDIYGEGGVKLAPFHKFSQVVLLGSLGNTTF